MNSFTAAKPRSKSSLARTIGLAGLIGLSCSKQLPPPGELVVSVSTDLSIPKDIDTIRMQVISKGVTRYDESFPVFPGGPAGVKIPATLGVVAGDDPSAPVLVRAVAIAGHKAVILREATVQVPADRTALLQLPLHWLCTGNVTNADPVDPTTDNLQSGCGAGQTCVSGSCVTSSVTTESLPSFAPALVYGAPSGGPDGGGQCFDTLGCFPGSAAAPLDMATCTVPAPAGANPSQINVALVPANGAGICGANGCFVPLDQDPSDGWTLAGGLIKLPSGLCSAIHNGLGATLAVSTGCASKTPALPTCGPWSTEGGGGDAGAEVDAGPAVTTLASGQTSPIALAVDATNVYWLNEGTNTNGAYVGGSVMKVAINGGTPKVVVSGLANAEGLAVDATSVYWTTSSDQTDGGYADATGRVMMAPLAGGTAITLASGQGGIAGLAIDAANVYWTTTAYDSAASQDVTSVMRVPLGGGAPSALASAPVGTSSYLSASLVVDAVNAYWVGASETDAGTQTTVIKAPLAGGKATPLASWQGDVLYGALALDASYLYYAQSNVAANPDGGFTSTPGSIMKVPLGGGAPATLAATGALPFGIAVDSRFVYWTDLGGLLSNGVGDVMKVPVGGGAATVVASSQNDPAAIVVTQDSLYWGNAGVPGDGGGGLAEGSGAIVKQTPK